MENIKIKIDLVVILLLVCFVMFYKLGSVPNGLYIDEVAVSYNAYSLLETGKDEFGKAWPILIRAQGLYLPPVYTYLTVISVYLFGLSDLAVRFWAAVSGVLMIVFILYFLEKNTKINRRRALVGTMFLVISPWIVLMSRFGVELSLGLFAFSFGTYLLWKGIVNNKSLVWGSVILSASMYVSHANRYLVPIFVSLLFVIYRKSILKDWKKLRIREALVLLVIISTPYLLIVNTSAFFTKGDLIGVDIINTQAEKIANYLPWTIAWTLAAVREVGARYLSYYSPRSLFFDPDPDLQRSLPELSVFYSWMIYPYLVGLGYIWRNRKQDLYKYLVILFIVTPIPASLTRDAFSSHRAIALFFPVGVIIVLGMNEIFKMVNWRIEILLAIGLFTFSSLMLWRSYFVFLPQSRAKYWGGGYSVLAREINNRPNEMFLIDQSRVKPSYIVLAYYMKVDPKELQNNISSVVVDNYYSNPEFSIEYELSNFETRNIDWERDECRELVLVGDSLAISEEQAAEHDLRMEFEIVDPMGEILFRGFKTNPASKCKKLDII